MWPKNKITLSSVMVFRAFFSPVEDTETFSCRNIFYRIASAGVFVNKLRFRENFLWARKCCCSFSIIGEEQSETVRKPSCVSLLTKDGRNGRERTTSVLGSLPRPTEREGAGRERSWERGLVKGVKTGTAKNDGTVYAVYYLLATNYRFERSYRSLEKEGTACEQGF